MSAVNITALTVLLEVPSAYMDCCSKSLIGIVLGSDVMQLC